MSKWIILCSDCDHEFKIEVEDVPERCPNCGFEGEFEVIDEEDDFE
ncbi:MAG: hypothetical protein FWF95_06655 [Syntrophorhabdaceae bacterium]|nr:hypothetical protein [Syntrophorhabdaceae bacterium]